MQPSVLKHPEIQSLSLLRSCVHCMICDENAWHICGRAEMGDDQDIVKCKTCSQTLIYARKSSICAFYFTRSSFIKACILALIDLLGHAWQNGGRSWRREDRIYVWSVRGWGVCVMSHEPITVLHACISWFHACIKLHVYLYVCMYVCVYTCI